ncbi:MAG: hypothetical protein BroJett005_20300 [Ignavibacteriota bacterium]|nr:MAG: hypothetical protein BroJett005_20300 [Ignavibacteriota bacterium]
MSDFFDRCSGGNGSGTLGSFKMIGDVVYVTTLKNENEYLTGHSGDTEIFTEILQTLDNIHGNYNINFKLYDNWKFKVNNVLYNHEYKPNVGDGLADHIFIINRGNSRKNGLWAEKTLSGVNFPTNDGVVISSYCGSRIFGFKNSYTPRAVGGPAHEYCHYLLGGFQDTGHFDGYNYLPSQTGNRGRINQFALMCAVNAGWMSAYERYRLGWLTPYVVQSNISPKVIKDTHIKNEAILIPLRDPYKGSWREFYLIENYHTQRDYANANPFLKDEVFGDPITHGLLVFHIEDQNYTLPCATKINILCADGKWTWKLLTGASTPYDRSDDLIGRDQPTRFGNYDERHFITIAVPPTTYSDYVCLIPRTDYPGARYNRNDFLGDFADFFGVGYNDVLTKYSNPGTYIIGGTAKDVGFEITGYNSTTKEYTLSLQVTAAGVTSLKPSKPQNPILSANPGNNYVRLSWEHNIENDKAYYEVSRKVAEEGGVWQVIGTTTNNYFVDNQFYYSNPTGDFGCTYRLRVKDTQNKFSVYSDEVFIRAEMMGKITTNIEPIISYNLDSNYPNPFNPSTIINYAVKDAGLVSIKVYDILGAEVKTLVNETKDAGNYSLEFNASALPSGVYIYTMQVNGFSSSKKMLLMK